MQKTTNDQGNQNSGSLLNQKTATKNQTMAATKTYTCPKLLIELKMPSEAPYSFSESFVMSEARLGVSIAIPIEMKET